MRPKNNITVYLYTDVLKWIGYTYLGIAGLHFVFMAPSSMEWDSISDYTEPVAILLYDIASFIAPVFAVLLWVLSLAVIGVIILSFFKGILSFFRG